MPKPPEIQLLPAILVAVTALAEVFAIGSHTGDARWSPPATWHALFASAVMPLIFAAVGYFVPVLTRSGRAPPQLAAIPLAALIAGAGIVMWFTTAAAGLRLGAPLLALSATLALTIWTLMRRRACLGAPHPCLNWYVAALAFLALGLLAVVASSFHPELAAPLRLFHLHANVLGFIGLTAIGTAQVLLPTVLGRPDPGAAPRLAADLPWSVAGAAAIAVGSAVAWPLAFIGLLAYARAPLRLLAGIARSNSAALLAPGQPATLLAAAILGLLISLAQAGIAALTGGNARTGLTMLAIGFLLPLVSGAAAHLLPLWLAPGSWQARHVVARSRLAAFARTRAALATAGTIAAALSHPLGNYLGAVVAAWLAVLVTLAFIRRP